MKGWGGVVGLVVVVVLVMDICVTEFWMQYKFLFTNPSKNFFLFGTASCWRAGHMECMILFWCKTMTFVSAQIFIDHIFFL